MDFRNPYLLRVDTASPYAVEPIPDAMWQGIVQKITAGAVQLMCQLDPSKKDLYESFLAPNTVAIPANTLALFKAYFAGVHKDPALIEPLCRASAFKFASIMRFEYERTLLRTQLDAVKIKNPVFIFNFPRCGSTFLYRLLSSHPKAHWLRSYEHMMPGSTTMSLASRKAFATKVLNAFTVGGNDEFKKIHHISCDEPEEEALFFELYGQALFQGYCLPRCDRVRRLLCETDLTNFYEAFVDEIRMHVLDEPMGDGEFLVFKSPNHLMSTYNFFKTIQAHCENPRFVWIHRETTRKLKSIIPMVALIRKRFAGDYGLDDYEALNRNVIDMIDAESRNSIAAREAWLAENPDNRKMLLDVSFTELTRNPEETVRKIYEYFGMEWSDDVRAALEKTLNDPSTQKKAEGVKLPIVPFDEEAVQRRFKYYHDYFREYV